MSPLFLSIRYLRSLHDISYLQARLLASLAPGVAVELVDAAGATHFNTREGAHRRAMRRACRFVHSLVHSRSNKCSTDV